MAPRRHHGACAERREVSGIAAVKMA